MGIGIAKGREGRFLLLLVLFSLGWLGPVIWHEMSYSAEDNGLSISIAVAKSMAQIVILNTVLAVIVVEGWPMLAEQFLKRRFAEGRAKGREESRKSLADALAKIDGLSEADKARILASIPPRQGRR